MLNESFLYFQMADTEELGSQPGLNGQSMGLLNGVQSTGNVQVLQVLCMGTQYSVCRPPFSFLLIWIVMIPIIWEGGVSLSCQIFGESPPDHFLSELCFIEILRQTRS